MINKNKRFKNLLTGFTLIELLVVIAIIGLLSTLAVIALDSAREKSRDAKRVTDIKQMQTALELYFNDQKGYPGQYNGSLIGGLLCLGRNAGATTGCQGVGSNANCLDSTGFDASCSTASGVVTYMAELPADPIPLPSDAIEYQYTPQDAGGGCASANCPTYAITFTLEGRVDALAKGVHTATPSGIQ